MTRQTSLSNFEPSPPSVSEIQELPTAERRAYVAVELNGTGVREYQRTRGYSSPGTVSNLLRRARQKLGEGSA